MNNFKRQLMHNCGGGGTLCPRTGKFGYLTRVAAKEAGKRVKRNYGQRVRVYKCPDCPSWHLTKRRV